MGCSHGKAARGKADGPVIIDGVLYAFSSDWATDAVPVADKTLPAGTDLNAIIEHDEYFQNATSNATLVLNSPEAVADRLRCFDRR